MQNFQDTFETRKQSCISAFSICMTLPLREISRQMDLLYHSVLTGVIYFESDIWEALLFLLSKK